MSETLQLDWSSLEKLLPLCADLVKQKREGADVDLHEAVNAIGQAFGIEDVDAFAIDRFRSAMETGLGQVMSNEDAAAIAVLFAKNSKPVMELVVKFATGGSDAADLVRALNKICFSDTEKLQFILQHALGISNQAAGSLAGTFGPYLVSIYCFIAAFKIYQRAAKDAQLAKERRIEAERLSQEAIALIKAEREEMDGLLSKYMLDRLLPFDEGVAAMDQAILDDDDDGFIRANVGLWEVFGREAQYSNASEFEDLMLSDEAFKL